MGFAPKNFTVWAEIPATDLERSVAFYAAVFQSDIRIEDMDPNPIAMFPTADGMGVAGHLYPGKPAGDGTGPTVHFEVPDSVEATGERVKQNGGTVLTDAIEIPPGRFAYCLDPDGNSIGLFESKKA